MKITYDLKDFDKGRIINKFGMEEKGDAELFLANDCFRRMHKYVPLRTGALASTVTVQPGKVTYEVPYARKQYYENKGKGLRGKEWDKKMIANERNIIAKEVEAYVKLKKGSR